MKTKIPLPLVYIEIPENRSKKQLILILAVCRSKNQEKPVEAPCGQLSNTLSEVINAITKFEDKHESECRSSEEMRAEVKKVNSKLKEERKAAQRLDAARRLEEQASHRLEAENMGGEGRTSSNLTSEGGTEVSADAQEGEVPAWRLESQRIVRSTDFKSYYPSLPIQRAAEMVKEMIER